MIMRILRLRAYYYPESVAASHLSDDMDAEYKRHGIKKLIYTPMPSRGIKKEIREKYRGFDRYSAGICDC